jgi:hypothetical protein
MINSFLGSTVASQELEFGGTLDADSIEVLIELKVEQIRKRS